MPWPAKALRGPRAPANPFPGLAALERELGQPLPARLSANEALALYPRPWTEAFEPALLEHCRQYPDPSALALRQALSRHEGVAPEHLLVDAGADSLIALMLRAYADAGEPVLCSEGTYPTFAYFARAQGLALHTVPYAGHGASRAIDLPGLLQAAQQLRPRLLYLANPDNPSGRFVPLAALKAWAARLPPGTLLLLDEAYLGFAEHYGDLGPWPATVRLRSFSKACGLAGLRVGYAVTSEGLLAPAQRTRIHYAVSGLSAWLAERMLAEPRHLLALRAHTLALRERFELFARLRGLPYLPSAANFVSLVLPASPALRHWHAAWLRRGVSMALPPPWGDDQLLRLTLHPELFQPALLEALSELPGALR
ncbi:aminotransferase class I/II-fold pyridoxal phosphate-dependent enzyme [Pseudomonas sp. NPDC007930]|uniref:pyridoxal phosphate-dependent aminotransferase n=1 Tax=Pseudomonas sp. NPDC007930 TaxID=3364417 RepID=UPI0036F18590